MASYSHLRKLAAMERDNALAVLDALLPDDPDARSTSCRMARRDRQDRAGLSGNTLVGAFARVVLEQQQQIDELRDALQSKRATAKAR